MESYSREVDEQRNKTDERLDNYAKKSWRYGRQVLANDEFSRNSTPRDELIHRKNEKKKMTGTNNSMKRITNIEKILDMDENTKENMWIRIKAKQW